MHVVYMSNLFLLLLSSIPLYGHTSLFIHLPVNGHLGCIQFRAIVTKAAINICIQVFVCTCVYISLE